MSSLSLSKLYGDSTLLYKSDMDTLLTELEAKTNGNIDSSNVLSGWGNLGQLTLSKDVSYYMGATDTATVNFVNSSSDWKWTNLYSGGNTTFTVEGTECARIDSTSNDFKVKKDVYFKDRSTAFSLYRILGTYQKPVLVYVDSTNFDVENNTETANQTLICFPTGPVAVTEDTAATNKFRRCTTSATANGYGSSHTGAADSGLRTGLSLAANTWYFVYAVRVQYGNDAGNNFILVIDDTDPTYTNHTTLNSRYGTDEWIYLGTIRRGFGTNSTTTLIPWQQDHQGWTYFTDRGAANDYFGININTTTVSSTTETSKWAPGVSNSGNNVPANVTAMKVDIQTYDDGDGDFEVGYTWWFSSTGVHAYLQRLESDGGTLGFCLVVPVYAGSFLGVRRDTDESADDAGLEIYLTGFLDHYV
jgi:hypothetical protein